MRAFEKIPAFQQWQKVEAIHRGWSTDLKFKVTKNQETFLLRIFQQEELLAKQQEYQFIKLLTYLEGEDLSDVLPALSPKRQLNLGVEAGRYLNKIHKLLLPERISQREIAQNLYEKKQSQLNKYKESQFCMPYQQPIISYLEKQLPLLQQRPVVYQHGDFHVGNFIYLPTRQVGVIDFNRWDFGDPYEEFYKLQFFSRNVSPLFAYGQLQGYFAGKVPTLFWQFQKLYTFHAGLYSLVWALSFGEKEIRTMEQQYQQLLEDYNCGELLVPKWFSTIQRKGLRF
ncbi:aminoglycoside phosphotransferase family protein [Enterococcus faecalis]|nr:aminoglycoside phosphotransferase family protein [Enterococcus faecalis]